MNRQPTLESERLLLRPLAEADWDALYAVAADREIWARHPMFDRWQEPVFRAFFADALAQGGALAVIEKASGKIVGSSRYQGHHAANGGAVEIGWTFLERRLWGKGYNAEMKRAMLLHAFRFVERVTFRVGRENVISRGAMTNIGGRLTDRIDMTETPLGPVPHVVFEITREEFFRGPLAAPAR